jgi:hypothetical protein
VTERDISGEEGPKRFQRKRSKLAETQGREATRRHGYLKDREQTEGGCLDQLLRTGGALGQGILPLDTDDSPRVVVILGKVVQVQVLVLYPEPYGPHARRSRYPDKSQTETSNACADRLPWPVRNGTFSS